MNIQRLFKSIFKNSCRMRRYSTRNILKLSERGMYQDIFPDTAANDIIALLKKSPQTVYAGFDPTADSLHVGHLLVLVNLLHWQRGGHNVVALLGGATGRIGDPSGRNTERQELQAEIVSENVKAISLNIENVFKNHREYFWKNSDSKLSPLRTVNNEKWYANMNAIDFVGRLGRHFRMGTMLTKKSVQSRINSSTGMSFTEFTYQILQAYDWLHLLQEYDCRFQVGGSDQLGNMSAGHELISRIEKKDVYGLILPLVTNEEGDKFGKSAGNALWLDPTKTSQYSLYQYFLRTKDTEVEKYLKLFTFYTMGEIKDIMMKHETHPEKRYAQTCLAEQLTMLAHGADGLKRAEMATEAFFSKDVNSLVKLSDQEMLQIFQGATVVNLLLQPGLTVFDLAMKAKCFPTEADAMRIIGAGGFYVNHQRCSKVDEVITQSAHLLPNMLSLVRVGKRNHYIIRWQA